MIAVYIFLFLLVLVMIAAYVCYRLAFSVPKQSRESLFLMPDTEQYTPYAALTSQMIRDALAIPYEPVSITSYDGLPLYGKCYLASPEAPWLIMFHGYRSGAERDFSGGLPFGIESGFNVLLVDQRAHGKSDGRCLTFGIKERRDCLSWIEYVRSRTEDTAKIVLYGMSMGAATVLMSTALKLPQNVVGIVADCGYTSPSAIIKKVLRDRHLPLFPTYALLRLGGRLYGGFDLEAASAVSAMEQCDIPILFIHGEDDRFVPCDMGRENYSHCRSPEKELLTISNAGHGMSYIVDKNKYLHAVSSFLKRVLA